ncbi:MAG: FAD binding domain-containing protein [Enterocloster bolteae]
MQSTAHKLLQAQGAKMLVQGPNKDRVIQIEDFFQGVKKTSLEPGEIVTGIVIPPLAENERAAYIKHAVRKAMDLPAHHRRRPVTIKVEDGVCTDARIALGAVAATPVRAPRAEETLIGKELTDEVIVKASEEAMNSCHPISDIRASAEYRKDMIRVFTKRAIKQAMECS